MGLGNGLQMGLGNFGDDGYVHYCVWAEDFIDVCSLYMYVKSYPNTFSVVYLLIHQLHIKAVMQKKIFLKAIWVQHDGEFPGNKNS